MQGNEVHSLQNMLCLSLWQPWAEMIFRTDDDGVSLKPDETRDWSTCIRGRIAIHASKKPLRGILRDYPQLKMSLLTCGVRDHQMAFGAIIGTVDLVDCRPASEVAKTREDWQLMWGDYRAIGDDGKRRFALVLENPQRLSVPIPYVGRQGFFRVQV